MSDRAAGRLGRRLAAGAAIVALAAGACADQAAGPDAATSGEVGEFAATSEYLTEVAEATEGMTYRMSMDMTMAFSGQGQEFEMGGRMMTGEVAGDQSAMTMDLGEMFRDMSAQFPADESMPEGFLEADLTMEMVTDGTTLYLRAPFFASMNELALDGGSSVADMGPLADIAALGDEWGSIDLGQLSVAEITSAAGGQQADPGVYLDMLAQGTDVQELGSDTIDGVGVRGLGAVVTYGDMIQAEGQDPDQFTDQMAGSMGVAGDELGAIFETMMATEIPVEVWVDGEDRVRRVAIDVNMAEIMSGIAEQTGEDMGDIGMSITMSMEFTDYDDESIVIEIPEDATDITDEYLALIESGGVDTGMGGSPLGST